MEAKTKSVALHRQGIPCSFIKHRASSESDISFYRWIFQQNELPLHNTVGSV